MDDLRFYVLFNSIQQYFSHIRTIGGDNEMLCAVEPYLRLTRFRLQRGSNSGTIDQPASA